MANNEEEMAQCKPSDLRLAFYYLSILRDNFEDSHAYYMKRYEESDRLLTNEKAKADHVQADINTICGWLHRNANYAINPENVSHLNDDYSMKKVIEF